MQHWGHAYILKILDIYLRFKPNSASHVLFGNPTQLSKKSTPPHTKYVGKKGGWGQKSFTLKRWISKGPVNIF